MEPPIIDVKNLSHRYGDLLAVDSVDFTVRKGEIFSFLGPNGAGKSTVINILTTLLGLQSGVAIIAGYNVAAMPEMVRRSIGIVFQEVTLDRDMTVEEILEFHGRLYGIPRNLRKDRINELLTLVELEQKRNILTRYLSGGMKRRLEIARGLMTRPRVLFLDEPTIGLDPQTRLKTWEYIKRVNKEGTTIFLTTHYMEEADQLSDRISIIDNGRIIVSGTPWELKNSLGQDVIYLETDDNRKVMELLQREDHIMKIMPRGKGFLLTIDGDGTKILPLIMEKVLLERNTILTANLKKPSMDDVFVHYTGREMRNGEIPPPRVPEYPGRK